MTTFSAVCLNGEGSPKTSGEDRQNEEQGSFPAPPEIGPRSMTLVELFEGAATEVHGPLPVGVTVSSQIESLDIDSMDLIEITMIMEERLDVTFEPSAFDQVTTVGDVVSVFEQLMNDGAGEL